MSGGPSADSNNKENIDAIVSAVKRGAGLCRELMAYAGKGKRDIDWINLRDMLEELKHLLQVTIPQHIEMRFSLDENLPMVRADGMQLEQVMMNLLINAREAIGGNQGVIEITGRQVTANREHLNKAYFDKLPDSLQFVELTVRDNGCGMTDEVRARLFDPFYTTKFTGRGLGMSAVLGIIQSHNGAIYCDSQAGEGTTFTILLPCSDSQPAEADEEVLGVDADEVAAGKTILLVEDEQALRDILRNQLSHAGYHVRAWGDGESALADYKMYHDTIDLLILDMSMPGMSGGKLLAALYESDHGLDAPVVVCSGEPHEDVMKKLDGKHVDAIVPKPVQSEKLLQLLIKLIARDKGKNE